jgi:hypothetical protein
MTESYKGSIPRLCNNTDDKYCFWQGTEKGITMSLNPITAPQRGIVIGPNSMVMEQSVGFYAF